MKIVSVPTGDCEAFCVSDCLSGNGVIVSDSIFSELFYLEHVSGDKLFPIKLRNRDTGKVSFRVSPGGSGGNTKEVSSEVDCEFEVRRLVFEQGYAVRAATRDKSRSGLYKLGIRSINRGVTI